MGVAHTDNPTGLYAEVELSRVHIVDKRVGYADIQVDLAGVTDVGKLERYEAEVLVGLGVNDAYVGAAVVRPGCLHGAGIDPERLSRLMDRSKTKKTPSSF